METWDLVVIGGGVAGLTAAIVAARAGQRVLVCERQSTLGGRAATEHLDGFDLNLGAHAIYRGGAATRVLRSLGVSLPGASPRTAGYVLDEGELHTMPAGPASLLTTTFLPPAAKWEMMRRLASLTLQSPARWRGKTTDEVVASLATQPASRALLRALLRTATYCADTDRSCGEAAFTQVVHLLQPGIFYVEHGWQTMIDALAGAARQAGATIRTGARAEAIEPAADAYTVRGEDLALRARRVVITSAPRVASRLLGDRSPSLASFAASAVPVRVACLDVAMRSVPAPRARQILGIDQPIFGVLHSETVRLAPPGGGVVHMLRYLREGETATEAHREGLEEALDRLQPGWRPLAVQQRWRPAMVAVSARIEAARGGVRGRPEVGVPELPGVVVAGDWAGHDGSLVDASFASGWEAAQQIVIRAGGARAVA